MLKLRIMRHFVLALLLTMSSMLTYTVYLNGLDPKEGPLTQFVAKDLPLLLHIPKSSHIVVPVKVRPYKMSPRLRRPGAVPDLGAAVKSAKLRGTHRQDQTRPSCVLSLVSPLGIFAS